MTSPESKEPRQDEKRQINFGKEAPETEEDKSSFRISSTIQKEKDNGSIGDPSSKEQSGIKNVKSQKWVKDNSTYQIDQNNLLGPFHQDIKTGVSSFLYLSDMYD